MQRIGSAPRVAAQFSLAFISIEIRLGTPRPVRPEVRAEQAAARATVGRALDAERRRAEARWLLRG
jgi:hypothetical protein